MLALEIKIFFFIVNGILKRTTGKQFKQNFPHHLRIVVQFYELMRYIKIIKKYTKKILQ